MSCQAVLMLSHTLRLSAGKGKQDCGFVFCSMSTYLTGKTAAVFFYISTSQLANILPRGTATRVYANRSRN